MKDLIERVRKFNEPADPETVDSIISFLGETPSLANIEAVLKFYKDEERAIRTKDLLEWMNDNDQITFETEDAKVSIKTYINAKIVDPIKGFNWLTENQYGDTIKDTVEFGKGEFDQDLEKFLEEKGYSYLKKSGVHPQTLKKIMNDRLSAGEMLPDEDMGISVGYHDECVVKNK